MNRLMQALRYLGRVARLVEAARDHAEAAKGHFEKAFRIIVEIAKTDERAAEAKAHMDSGFARLNKMRQIRDEAFPREGA